MINLKLDKNGGINKGDIVVSEHDNKSEEYIIQLIKNNNILDISNKSVTMTIINKETKEGDIFDLNIYNAKEGQVKLEVTSNLTKCNGEYIAKIKLKDSTGYEESFPIFDITINIDLVEELSGEIIQNPTFTLLNTALDKLVYWDNYFKDVAPILENKYITRLTTLENKVTENKTLFDNALKGKTITEGNNVINKIPFISEYGGMEIGKYLDFHSINSNIDFDGRLIFLDTKIFEFSHPIKTNEIGTKFIKLNTFPDYGNELETSIWVDNRENIKRMQIDGILEFLIPQGKVMATSFQQYSDARIKNILPNTKNKTSDLQNILSIEPKYFKFINENSLNYGFIAQEVEKIIPNAVKTIKYKVEDAELDKEGNPILDKKAINLTDLVATLWGAVKELNSQVEELKKQIIK